MTHRPVRPASLAAAIFAIALGSLPAHGLQRAFVSAGGDDANEAAGCILAAPCRSFFAAHNAGDAGGGITINTVGIKVLLRNLSINGAGATGMGVVMDAGMSLAIENCVISNLGMGVFVRTAADVRITGSVIRGNANSGAYISGNASAHVAQSRFVGNGVGIQAEAGSGGTTSVAVSDSVADGTGASAVMTLGSSMASGNALGFHNNALAGSATGDTP